MAKIVLLCLRDGGKKITQCEQVCLSFHIYSFCGTQSETNKTRLQTHPCWTSVPHCLLVRSVIPSLAAVHLWIPTNIQQTS